MSVFIAPANCTTIAAAFVFILLTLLRFFLCDIEVEMISVPAGTFRVGTDDPIIPSDGEGELNKIRSWTLSPLS